MTRTGLLILILSAALTLPPGCSDETSFVGSGLLPKDVQVDSLAAVPDSSATYRVPITGNTPTLLLGRYQSVESSLLLQFGLPSGIAESSIVSIELKLITRYWFKDSTGTLAFTIHKAVRSWSQTTATFDSLNGLYDPVSSGSFAAAVMPSDTVRAAIDTAVVREWMRTGVANGLVLVPAPSCNVVYGFTSFVDLLTDIRPELIYRYIVADSTQRLDSVVARASQDAFVANAPLPTPTGASVVLQGGVTDRGLFRFNVASIPRSASITSATLEFTRDPALSERNEFSFDSVFVQLIVSVDAAGLPQGGIFNVAEPVGGESATVFRAEIARIVQQWVTGTANHGLSLRAYGEFSSLDRFVFYGASDSLYRPRLNIRYSVLEGSK